MDMKTFKNTFKFICKRCGKLSRTGKRYCDKCRVHTYRKATKDDYTKFTDLDRRVAEIKNACIKEVAILKKIDSAR